MKRVSIIYLLALIIIIFVCGCSMAPITLPGNISDDPELTDTDPPPPEEMPQTPEEIPQIPEETPRTPEETPETDSSEKLVWGEDTSDFTAGNFSAGLTYGEFISSYSGEILSTEYTDTDDLGYNPEAYVVTLPGTKLFFGNFMDTELENWKLFELNVSGTGITGPRGIKIGDSMEKVLSCFPRRFVNTPDWVERSEYIYFVADDPDGGTLHDAKKVDTAATSEITYCFGIGQMYSEYYSMFYLTFQDNSLVKMLIWS